MNSIKKLLLNQGGAKTVEGVPPLTLTRTQGNPLIDYKIYGNGNGVGDRTSNIADISKYSIPASTPHVKVIYDKAIGMIELTSTPSTFDYCLLMPEDMGLEVGKTYYYGGIVTVTGKQTSNLTYVAFCLGVDSGAILNFTQNGTRETWGTFTYNGQSNARFRMYFNYGSVEPAYVKIENIYVSEVINEFEPVGYKIPIISSNGTEEITTNIYLDEPLRKVGDYADYIDFENQKVFRNGDVEKSIELPSISTVKGTTILDSNTSIKPSNMKVIYKKG